MHEIHYALGHRATEGHFDGHPIIPGVVILRDVMSLARRECNVTITNIRAAKFTRPIVPGETMAVTLRANEDATTLNFKCAVAGQSAVKGTFDCAPTNKDAE